MTHYLVTGASGLLGLNFALRAAAEHKVTGVVNQHALKAVPFDVVQADLVEPGGISNLLDRIKPDVIVHCAAQANLEVCENDPEQAYQLNAWLPGEIAREAFQRAIKLVHISTDAVFSGVESDFKEEDPTHPLSVYAQSKLAGEQVVLAANPDAAIARVNFYGWSMTGKRSLAEFFYNRLAQNQPVNGFTDMFFCPLLVNDLADILMEMVSHNLSGVYHAVSRECLSKYAFGCAIADQFGLDRSLITPISVNQGGLNAPRSHHLRLNSEKLAQALGKPLPDQASGMHHFFELFQSGYPQKLKEFAVNL